MQEKEEGKVNSREQNFSNTGENLRSPRRNRKNGFTYQILSMINSED